MECLLAANDPTLEYTYKSVTYIFTGDSLLKDGFEYHPHPEKFFPPKPSKTAALGNGPKQVQMEKKPVGWWKAQCAFRGLSQSGSINDIQLRLKDAKKTMLPEL